MSDKGSAPKRQKLAAAEGDQNGLQVAGPSNQQQLHPTPDIFKLTVDCCEEICEYLSLEELHSFGQTCKIFNKVAGEYFKRNYSSKSVYIDEDGVYIMSFLKRINLSGFHRYVTMVNCVHRHSEQYLVEHADEFASVRYMYCNHSILNHNAIIQRILPKLEFLHLTNFGTLNAEVFYEKLSRICPNLQSLFVHNNIFQRNVSYEHRWLHQIYPNLKQLRCTDLLPPIDHLNIFFEQNPSVHGFSARLKDIWENRNSFLSSKIKLGLLKVDNFDNVTTESIELLNQLYNRRFYKRLHLSMRRIDQQCSYKLLTLQGLEKLSVYGLRKGHNLPQLTRLQRLDLKFDFILSPYSIVNELDALANGLINLERISFEIKLSNNALLALLRRSIYLKKIKVHSRGIEKVLNLTMLNKEREKLVGARKVTIYVEDDVYLATKWATKNGDTNLSLVEIRRMSSFEWDEFE